MASVIANEFTEATTVYLSALIELVCIILCYCCYKPDW